MKQWAAKLGQPDCLCIQWVWSLLTKMELPIEPWKDFEHVPTTVISNCGWMTAEPSSRGFGANRGSKITLFFQNKAPSRLQLYVIWVSVRPICLNFGLIEVFLNISLSGQESTKFVGVVGVCVLFSHLWFSDKSTKYCQDDKTEAWLATYFSVQKWFACDPSTNAVKLSVGFDIFLKQRLLCKTIPSVFQKRKLMFIGFASCRR